MHRPHFKPNKSVLVALLLLWVSWSGSASATTVSLSERPLQLEVFVHQTTTGLIGNFVQMADGRIAVRRSELTELGVRTPGTGSAEELVVLARIPGFNYRYDEPAQKIYFTLGDGLRLVKTYDARSGQDATLPVRADYGAALNYAFFGSTALQVDRSRFEFSGANLSLDGRLFGPYGTLSHSAILGSTTTKEIDALRLDTAWTYSDPETLTTYRAGDAITGGLPWTRPVRFGGLQMQRNFALRPDLVTLALPSLSSSAAVPSTLDVYVNGLKTFSQDVDAGPFQVNNLPVLTGGGTARVVLRDAAGREIESNLPFYASAKLVRPGVTDFSLDAGFPRFEFGTESMSYDPKPIASASLRRGVYDWLTLEAHAEAGANLINAGIGAVTRLGSWGVLSMATSASESGGAFGVQSYAALDAQVWGVSFHASSQRTFGDYQDLASVTAPALTPSVRNAIGSLAIGAKPPKAIDTISLSLPLTFDKSSLGLSYVHIESDQSRRSDIVSASYSRSLFKTASVSISAFVDLDNRKSSGVFVGVSIPLGGSVSTATSVSSTPVGTSVSVDATKPLSAEPGSYGWRLHDSEGGKIEDRLASVSYRASAARMEANVRQEGTKARATAQVEGAIVTMGNGLFFSNRIDDAFAVVDTRAPNVAVFYENRPVGKTDSQGQLLIPGLKSYQRNKISIDPRDLPLDAESPTSKNIVAPADRSGVRVDFGVKTNVKAAIVVLSRQDGKLIPAGSEGQLVGGQPFVVGYDGKAYITGLAPTNTVLIREAGRECRASFVFTSKQNAQLVIGPVVCQ